MPPVCVNSAKPETLHPVGSVWLRYTKRLIASTLATKSERQGPVSDLWPLKAPILLACLHCTGGGEDGQGSLLQLLQSPHLLLGRGRVSRNPPATSLRKRGRSTSQLTCNLCSRCFEPSIIPHRPSDSPETPKPSPKVACKQYNFSPARRAPPGGGPMVRCL